MSFGPFTSASSFDSLYRSLWRSRTVPSDIRPEYIQRECYFFTGRIIDIVTTERLIERPTNSVVRRVSECIPEMPQNDLQVFQAWWQQQVAAAPPMFNTHGSNVAHVTSASSSIHTSTPPPIPSNSVMAPATSTLSTSRNSVKPLDRHPSRKSASARRSRSTAASKADKENDQPTSRPKNASAPKKPSSKSSLSSADGPVQQTPAPLSISTQPRPASSTPHSSLKHPRESSPVSQSPPAKQQKTSSETLSALPLFDDVTNMADGDSDDGFQEGPILVAQGTTGAASGSADARTGLTDQVEVRERDNEPGGDYHDLSMRVASSAKTMQPDENTHYAERFALKQLQESDGASLHLLPI